jgi:predicted DNA-binding transcriptional regulator AlpA
MKTQATAPTPEVVTDTAKPAAIPANTFLSEKELLKRLPISRRTLWNWRHQKKIPAIVIGRRVLFCWENVSAALRRLEKGVGAE